MKLAEIIEQLSLELLTSSGADNVTVAGGFCSDLLSHVLSAAKPGDLWITIQHHANVVAVAQVAGLSAVLLADGKRPDSVRFHASRAWSTDQWAWPPPNCSYRSRCESRSLSSLLRRRPRTAVLSIKS